MYRHAFQVSRSSDEPKSRSVDGTPENCFYICGLRKLFPKAQFVHLVRDVTDVVPSLLNFFPDGGHRLVKNEAAYEYWLRTVNCCVQAEQAYGPNVVYRLRYSDLIERSEFAWVIAHLPWRALLFAVSRAGATRWRFQCAGRFQSGRPGWSRNSREGNAIESTLGGNCAASGGLACYRR